MDAKQKATVLALATALAIPAEGLRQKFYYDPPGILTVCYGHTGDVLKDKTYTLDECKALLNKDMLNAISAVDSCRPGLPTPVLAAFSDAVYNIGPRIACDTLNSTAARMLRDRDFLGACNQLPRWNQARLAGTMVGLPGLTKRREAERQLCLTGI